MERVVIISFCAGRPATFRGLSFECEDVLLATVPGTVRMPALAREGEGRAYRRVARRFMPAAASNTGPAVDGPIDLLIVDCMGVGDLRMVPDLRSLLRRADRAVCNVTEIWSHTVSRRTVQLLRAFDFIASGCATSVDPIADHTGRPVHYVPPAVDALAWSAPDACPPRSIDVFLFGRKHQKWHDALKEDSAGCDYFYLYDTVHARDPISLPEHRAKFRELNQRSKINVVNIAKVNHTADRGVDEEIGFRYFEAAAAGCALVGYRPATEHWSRLFGWPGSIVDVPLDDPPALVRAVRGLLEDPGALQALSRRNRAESLLRHDALYRWMDIFKSIGIEPTPEMEARRRRLARESDALLNPAPESAETAAGA